MITFLWGLLLALAAAMPGTAGAATDGSVLVLRDGASEYAPVMELYRDEHGASFGDIRAAEVAGVFEPAPARVPNAGYGAPAHWARIHVRNDTQRANWLLAAELPSLDRLELYVVGEDGSVKRTGAGDAEPFRERPLRNRNFVFPVTLAPGEVASLYLRVETEGALALPVSLYGPERWIEREQTNALLLGGYYGVMLLMIVYSCVLAFSLRSKAYFYYAGLHAFTLLMFLSQNGLAYQYLWPEAVEWNQRSGTVFLCLGLIFALLFTRTILRIRETRPRLHVLFNVFIAAVGANLTVALLYFPLGLQLSIGSLVAVQLAMIVACAVGWRQGSSPAKYFLLGWSAFMAGALVSSLADAGALPMEPWTANAAQAGSALQAIALAFGLSEHLRKLRKDKERAVALWRESMRLADSDELTGLFTRRYVSQAFEAAVRHRPERNMTLVMIDVDHFKRVNDTYGHDTGDQVLRELGRLIKEQFARTDIPGRFGGEEFMVLLPDTTLEQAGAAADRLMSTVRSYSFGQERGRPLYCTVSIGIAQWRGGEETFLQLLRRADEALYEAKREGRNRVSVAGKAG